MLKLNEELQLQAGTALVLTRHARHKVTGVRWDMEVPITAFWACFVARLLIMAGACKRWQFGCTGGDKARDDVL